MKKYLIGDSCVCWEIGGSISLSNTLIILSVYRQLKNTSGLFQLGVYDIVPSYTAIAVHYDPMAADTGEMEKIVDECFKTICSSPEKLLSVSGGKTISIPVVYNGEDLDRIAEMHSLTRHEVVALHKQGNYTVAMVGFKPHFPYLIGLDKKLKTPRLSNPRTKVPAGSVAIGGEQTGIYPVDSPGGWNIIGMTTPDYLKTIEPGDRIRFTEVDVL